MLNKSYMQTLSVGQDVILGVNLMNGITKGTSQFYRAKVSSASNMMVSVEWNLTTDKKEQAVFLNSVSEHPCPEQNRYYTLYAGDDPVANKIVDHNEKAAILRDIYDMANTMESISTNGDDFTKHQSTEQLELIRELIRDCFCRAKRPF